MRRIRGERSNNTRSSLIIKLRQQHPEWSLAKIESQVGVSRQRVHQLLIRHSLPTSSSKSKDGNRGGTEAKTEVLDKVKETSPGIRYRETKNEYKPRFTKIPIGEALALRKPVGSSKVLEEYKKYIVSLGSKEAGKFEVSSDKEGQMLRTRIIRSAKALGLDVTVKKINNEILFWLNTEG